MKLIMGGYELKTDLQTSFTKKKKKITNFSLILDPMFLLAACSIYLPKNKIEN